MRLKVKVQASKGMFHNELLIRYGDNYWWVDDYLVTPHPKDGEEIDALLIINIYAGNRMIIDSGIMIIDEKDLV